ncbi:uncharacterized protein [Leptinotarsa decemlineata]|uniref:uncharacterized protein n=1 Tax=Leptinotarsa decemlineata TaxID=7539 RepID=UPI003D30564B
MEMDPKEVYDSRRLCDSHFEAKYISAWSHKLFGNAVPILYLPGSTGPNDVYDTPSTSESSNSSAQESTQFNELIIEIPELNESSHSIEGNAGSALLSPYQLLISTGIAKHTMTPKKEKMYGALQQLRKKYTIERNKKK